MPDRPDLPLYNYRATVVNVVDGDTIDVTIDLGFHVSTTLRLRLAGINAPEMTGASRQAGRDALAFLALILLDEEVLVVTEKDRTEKYGRYLATVILNDGTNVNARMIEAGHAVAYGDGPRFFA